jgi:hypothetical protein
MLGGMDTPIIGTFTWTGIDWTPDIHHRHPLRLHRSRHSFDIARRDLLRSIRSLARKPKRIKNTASDSAPEPVSTFKHCPRPV